MSKLVYLGGPITGQTFGQATKWRDIAARFLASHGIATLSPMRADNHTYNLADVPDVTDANAWQQGLLTEEAITARDVMDVQRSDVLLFNFCGATTISRNSLIEVGLGHGLQKPMVVAMEEGNVHSDILMLRNLIPFKFYTLNDALRSIVTLLE